MAFLVNCMLWNVERVPEGPDLAPRRGFYHRVSGESPPATLSPTHPFLKMEGRGFLTLGLPEPRDFRRIGALE
jgi:hypothetical protein